MGQKEASFSMQRLKQWSTSHDRGHRKSLNMLFIICSSLDWMLRNVKSVVYGEEHHVTFYERFAQEIEEFPLLWLQPFSCVLLESPCNVGQLRRRQALRERVCKGSNRGGLHSRL